MSIALPRTALALGIAALVAILASVPLEFLGHGGLPGIVLVPFLALGAIVTRRRTRHRRAAHPGRLEWAACVIG